MYSRKYSMPIFMQCIINSQRCEDYGTLSVILSVCLSIHPSVCYHIFCHYTQQDGQKAIPTGSVPHWHWFLKWQFSLKYCVHKLWHENQVNESTKVLTFGAVGVCARIDIRTQWQPLHKCMHKYIIMCMRVHKKYACSTDTQLAIHQLLKNTEHTSKLRRR